MRIAVLSDTHDRLPVHVRAALIGAEEIWHLGDVCTPSLLDQVRQIGPPVRWVKGNCDPCPDWPLVANFTLEGFRIRLIHIPPAPTKDQRLADPVDLLLHGHTHVPRNEFLGETRILNPGCITRPNRGAPASYAWLEIEKGEVPKWNLALV